MSTIKDGGPAFPQKEPLTSDWHGMTLRDYFAAKAMHQFLRGSVFPVGCDALEQMDAISRLSYVMADAMLKVREQNGNNQ